MEFVADHGVEWRRKFIKLSQEKGLNIDFIDPTNKPGDDEMQIGENKEHQLRLKREGRFLELRNYVHGYRRYDLRFVDISDFLVVVIDPRVPQWGTANEVYFAEMQHKPMFFICENGLYNLPNWLFDVVDIREVDGKTVSNVYGSIEDVIEELVSLDMGYKPMTDEWVLVRKHIERNRRV
jgi:hypothetical protein